MCSALLHDTSMITTPVFFLSSGQVPACRFFNRTFFLDRDFCIVCRLSTLFLTVIPPTPTVAASVLQDELDNAG